MFRLFSAYRLLFNINNNSLPSSLFKEFNSLLLNEAQRDKELECGDELLSLLLALLLLLLFRIA
jgi:hypothetical protein